MFRKNLTEIRVGLFVSIGLVLAMVVIFMVGGEHKLFERHYTLYANFETISGLRIGAPVQLAGLKVGFVDNIQFPRNVDDRNITVAIQVKKEFQDRIRGDSIATVETQGLLGDKFVYISVGSEAQAIIPNKGILPSKETASIFSLAEKAGTIMDDIGKASEAVNEMLTSVKGKKGEGDIKASIQSLRNTIVEIEKGKGVLHAMIYDPKGEKVIDDFAKTMESLRDIATGVDKSKKGEVGGIITNLRSASADLKKVMESISRGDGTLGKLVGDPALYNDLSALVGRANRNALLRAVIRSTISENDKQVLKEE